MLSDEEKKEYIEHEILDRLYCLEENDFDKNKVDDGYIKAVLNACKEAKKLIEKQSKEIEELKEEYNTKLLSNAGIYQLGFNDGEKSVKGKIKAKIEERQKRMEQLHPGSDCVIIDDLENEIDVLQSLLEKE